MNEAANDSARVSGQYRKTPPALGTNKIAGFGGFRPLASLEKNKEYYFNENFTNVRKTWEGINSLLKRKKNKNKIINTVNSEEEERNIQNIPAAELQQLAKKFVLGVKKENGEEYETSSLRRFLQSVKKDAHFLF